MKLLIPGVLGATLGSFVLIEWGIQLSILINLYLIIMGIRILFKAVNYNKERKLLKRIPLLGLIGGFLDAIGGGGWGPVVTSSLIVNGENIRIIIGSVNIAEFFVTLVQVAVFVTFFEDMVLYINVILSLILGGVIAAPLAAMLCGKLPTKFLLVAIGLFLIILNVYALSEYL